MFREISKAAALHQPGDAHGRASAALDICTSLVDRCGNVIGIFGCDREYAWFGEPGVNPSQSLCEAGLVTDKVRVLDIGGEVLAGDAVGIFDACIERKFHRDEVAIDLVVEPFPC